MLAIGFETEMGTTNENKHTKTMRIPRGILRNKMNEIWMNATGF